MNEDDIIVYLSLLDSINKENSERENLENNIVGGLQNLFKTLSQLGEADE